MFFSSVIRSYFHSKQENRDHNGGKWRVMMIFIIVKFDKLLKMLFKYMFMLG